MSHPLKRVLKRVIVGNVVFNPDALRKYLKKSSYYMSYNPNEETLRFSANDGGGGEDLFILRNISYESAVKMADELGLVSAESEGALNWSKWNPVYRLYHDGSDGAESLRLEMLRLGLPFKLHTTKAGNWSWQDGQYTYDGSMWPFEKVISLIRENAERYSGQLASTP